MGHLHVALVLNKVTVFTGGVKRYIKILEHSVNAGIDFTVFTPLVGTYDKNTLALLRTLSRNNYINLVDYRNACNGLNKDFEVVVVPTENWLRPMLMIKKLKLEGPYGIVLQDLPMFRSLDVLKVRTENELKFNDLFYLPQLLRTRFGYTPVDSVLRTMIGLPYLRFARFLPNCFLGNAKTMEYQLRWLGFRNTHTIDPMNGIEGELIKKTKEEWDGELLYDAIYSSRLYPDKGFFDLLYILYIAKKLLKKPIKVAVCGISGEKKYVQHFWDLVNALNLSQNIYFLGELSQVDLFKARLKSKLLIYPSYVDCFSLVIAETLALGVPILAYNIDAVRYEWAKAAIMRARVGDYKDMGTKLAYLLSDSHADEIRTIAQRDSSRITETYSWEKAVKAERQFYDWIIKSA